MCFQPFTLTRIHWWQKTLFLNEQKSLMHTDAPRAVLRFSIFLKDTLAVWNWTNYVCTNKSTSSSARAAIVKPFIIPFQYSFQFKLEGVLIHSGVFALYENLDILCSTTWWQIRQWRSFDWICSSDHKQLIVKLYVSTEEYKVCVDPVEGIPCVSTFTVWKLGL